MTDTEERDARASRELMRDWAARWVEVDPPVEYGAASASIRRQILIAKRSIRQFATYEGPYLPSRTLYRRMCEMDDVLLRVVFGALPKAERDRIDAEAEASVKKHGSVKAAFRAITIRDRFGIPRL